MSILLPADAQQGSLATCRRLVRRLTALVRRPVRRYRLVFQASSVSRVDHAPLPHPRRPALKVFERRISAERVRIEASVARTRGRGRDWSLESFTKHKPGVDV